MKEFVKQSPKESRFGLDQEVMFMMYDQCRHGFIHRILHETSYYNKCGQDVKDIIIDIVLYDISYTDNDGISLMAFDIPETCIQEVPNK